MTESLFSLFKKHECDKGIKHRYDIIYERDFRQIRNERFNFLEIGLERGKSIRTWVDYFPNANIYTIDNFSSKNCIGLDNLDILEHPRVSWAKGDSTDKSFSRNIWPNVEFDIIIDDGDHRPKQIAWTFLNYFPRLSKRGIYYVEDYKQIDFMTVYEEHNNVYKENDFTVPDYKEACNIFTNDYALEIFRENAKSIYIYNNKEFTNHFDSCILKMRKP